MKIYANRREKDIDDFIGKDEWVKILITCKPYSKSNPYSCYAQITGKSEDYSDDDYSVYTMWIWRGGNTHHFRKDICLAYPTDVLTEEELEDIWSQFGL